MNLDQDRTALGVGFDAEVIAPHERVVREMRNLMIFNGFVEYVEECLAKDRLLGRTCGDAYIRSRSESRLDWRD